jgi:ribosomal protein S18 acetylase RimI-like enzyme
MRRSLAGLPATTEPIAPAGVTFRTVIPDDAEALALLMDDAYRGTIDAEPGQGLDDARGEIASTFSGGYGRFMPDASWAALEDDDVVSAVLVTRFEDAPFIAFTMTRADRKGRGLSTALLAMTFASLADGGAPHVDLVVTAGNEPAERIYAALGFEVVETLG